MKKILIVDDNPIVIDTLTALLSRHEFNVVTAMDGMQATMQAVKTKPHLILLDIMMPAGGGIAVYNRLKQSAETQNIPILFLSGLPIESLQGKISVLDRDLFIMKPWDNDKLLGSIKEALDRTASRS